MKKFLVLLTAIVFIVGCFAIPAAAASATVSAPAQVNVGQDVTVTVTLPAGLPKAVTLGVAVTYNEDMFTIKSAPDASWMFGPSGMKNQALGNWMSNDVFNGESIDGKVLNFTFTCKETATAGTYSFSVAFNETFDPMGNPISIAGGSANVTVVVPQIAVTGVTLAPATANVNVAGTTTLVATVAPANATNKKVTYTSSDPTVATVDANGVVLGVKEGTAVITATTEDGGKTATCVVTVTCAHNFNKKDETNSAALKEEGNCNKESVYYFFCSVCGTRGGDSNIYNGNKVEGKHQVGDVAKNETHHWNECKNGCGAKINETVHTGGEATCKVQALCACGAYYGSLNAENHKGEKKQLAEEAYLVPGSGATCQEFKKYYKVCADCNQKTTEEWTGTVKGAHNYGELVQAKEAVHTIDKLEPAVAAHYQCSVCATYFTEAQVETNLAALTGETPVHTYGAYVSDAQNHWKECSCTKRDSEGKHIYDGEADMICNTCNYDRSCTHSNALVHVEAKPAECTVAGNIEYWYCPDCLVKFNSANAATATKLTDVTVAALGHEESAAYTSDEENHWKTCSREGCGIVLEETKAKHTGTATCVAKAVCPTCEKEYGSVDASNHKKGALEHSADKHWYKCDNGCEAHLEEADHTGGTATCVAKAACTVCTTEYGSVDASNHKKGALEHSADKHWYKCDNGCEAHLEEADHTGGTATCENKPVCSVCETAYGEALGHNYDKSKYVPNGSEGHGYKCINGCGKFEAIIAHDGTDPDCEDCGYVYHTCGVDMTHVPAVIGNCMTKGRQAYYQCSCGKFYKDAAATEIINSLSDIEFYGAHAGVVVPAVPATCTTSGMTQSMSCSVCRMQFMVAQTIPALGHNWSEWTTTLEPTDFVEGSKSRTCANCNETETAAIPALGHEHTVVELPAVDATCTATGLTAGAKCEVCGEILKAQEEVAMIAHATEKVDAKAATATEDGNVEYWTCTACAGIWLDEQLTTVATKEETVIPATGEVVIEAPSAEEGGEATVIVSGTGIAAGTKLEVTYKPAEEFAHISVTVEGKKGNIKQVVDINLQLDGNKVQPDGSVQVKVYIDAELRNIENLGIIHIAEDGTIEFIAAERQGNYLVFNTNHFSNYAVVELIEAPTTEPEETTAAPEETTAAPEETTAAPEETTAAPEETTAAPEETTAAPEETTAAPEETTAAPEETTAAPEDITVPEETTVAPEETTAAPEETTATPEETTSPEVPSTGDNAIFFIVSIIAMATIFAAVVSLKKKRNDN